MSWKNVQHQYQSGVLIALAATLALGPTVGLLEIPHAAAAVPVANSSASSKQSLSVDMKEFGDPQGYRLRTVKTQRDYAFTRPKGWKILPSTRLTVKFQHGTSLLPERSSLNILVNNRILKSVPLDKGNVAASTVQVSIPPSLLNDKNTLSFQVDQHYTYKCEDPYSEELWTEILPETVLTLDYEQKSVSTDLSQYPFPLLDALNNYHPTAVGYVLPTGLSSDSLQAFGIIAAHMGQQAKWRRLAPYVVGPDQVTRHDSLVVVGTPSENSAIASIASGLDLKLSGGKFVDKSGAVIPDDQGVLQLVSNPSDPTHAILVVSGNGSQGVLKAAHVLAQAQLNKVLVGRSAIVKDYNAGDSYPYRAWEGFILKSGDNFFNLGLPTQTARGITALPLFYRLKMMPDILLRSKQHVKLHTVYSYASQLDTEQSKLEVLLNGKAIKSIPLDDKQGKNLANATVDIPTEAFNTYNDLEFRFRVYPEKYDMCRFVTDAHIWGTVHNTSFIEFPGEVKTPLPDVGLINDGGYPFTAYQDMSKTSVVLPDQPSAVDLNAMLQFLTRMGRESSSLKGIELSAYKVSDLPDDEKKDRNLVVIGQSKHNKIFKDLHDKSTLLIEDSWHSLQDEQKQQLTRINYQAGQGIVEEMLSPWNDNRVVLMLTGENEAAIEKDAALFQNDSWFKQIKNGNLTVVNGDGPKSTILLKKGEARFFYMQDQQTGFTMPVWGWIVLGFLSLLGIISILRFLFSR